MVDIGLLYVGVAARARGRVHVPVAGGVDHDLRAHRLAPGLALENRAAHPAFLHERCGDPGVVDEVNLAFEEQFLRQQLEALGVDCR